MEELSKLKTIKFLSSVLTGRVVTGWRVALSVLLLGAFGQLGASQDVCSLKVRVLSPDGRRPEASVTVIEKNGRIIEKEHGDFDVEFCDLGGRGVTVKVGLDWSCNQVVVNNVPVSWGIPYLLTVTYDPMPCMVRDFPRSPTPYCSTIFRVSDHLGSWIPGARVHVSAPVRLELITDRFGRTEYSAELGKTVYGVVEGQGAKKAFSFTCSTDERVREEYVRLDTKGR